MCQPKSDEAKQNDWTAADILEHLEEKVAMTITKQNFVYRRLCEILDECKGIIDHTSGHLENLKKSILHLKTIPIDDLLLNYCYTKGQNDRQMLREARKMISLIGLDDPNLDSQDKREIDRKIRDETEIQDFIKRAERGLAVLRKMWQMFEENTNGYKTLIDSHGAEANRLLNYLRITISGECNRKTVEFFRITACTITRFIMYWNKP